MIEKVYYVKSDSINPYYNLGMEEYLFHNIPANSMILYLWQNEKTVVIGKNQNAYKECNLNAMENDHCYLARRSSGGGAVYHDLGNINYTFLMYLDNYDIQKQHETIIHALNLLGLPAEYNGKNDIEVNGLKVSGNAYMTEREHCLHHGTILWNVKMSNMNRYLQPSEKNIKARGEESVSARVANLVDFNPQITLQSVEKALLQAVADNYGSVYEMAVPTSVEEYVEKYHSYNYIYNRISPYTVMIHDYYNFGEVQLYADIDKGIIKKVDIFTDSLDSEIVEKLHRMLDGMPVDDINFKRRLAVTFDKEYHRDMARLYLAIKKYCYR